MSSGEADGDLRRGALVLLGVGVAEAQTQNPSGHWQQLSGACWAGAPRGLLCPPLSSDFKKHKWARGVGHRFQRLSRSCGGAQDPGK